MDRVDNPVDTRVLADRVVLRVDENDLKVLVRGVLVDPVRVEHAKVGANATDALLGDGAKVALELETLDTLVHGLAVDDPLLVGALAAAAAHADAVDHVALLGLVTQAARLVRARRTRHARHHVLLAVLPAPNAQKEAHGIRLLLLVELLEVLVRACVKEGQRGCIRSAFATKTGSIDSRATLSSRTVRNGTGKNAPRELNAAKQRDRLPIAVCAVCGVGRSLGENFSAQFHRDCRDLDPNPGIPEKTQLALPESVPGDASTAPAMRGSLCCSARLLVFVVAFTAFSGVLGTGCSWTAPSGDIYDLSGLRHSDYWKVSDQQGNYDYYLNLCQDAKMPKACNKPNMPASPAYQVEKRKWKHMCKELASLGKRTWNLLDPKDPQKGVELTYGGGQKCGKRPREIRYHFICAPHFDSGPLQVFETKESCHYNVTWASKYGCPVGKTWFGAPGENPETSTFGSTMRLLFMACIAYVVIGCAFLKYTKPDAPIGLETCPNSDFWLRALDKSITGFNIAIEKAKDMASGSGSSTPGSGADFDSKYPMGGDAEADEGSDDDDDVSDGDEDDL